ncbi:DUF4396 domain-containing protein [Streptomyces wuyuanensis]|uniref:DUF4396 domain-containing protein n=1 Tax=Streptomyces wuyuanensis TaxID=1196353 RepID=A0A1G9N877_9ACTN|nr:DUF4396 domain-containing protein [Streptomyces wuyuanensis]SDL82065.1 protein of unknown function [Streptomyces wuyuanensis]
MDHTSHDAGATGDRAALAPGSSGGHTGRSSHNGHSDHAGHRHGGVTWSTAAKATLHCLIGCAIGEILGMVIGTALMWGNLPTMILAITLAFLFGYSFTMFAVLRAGVDFRGAVKVALAADTLSIAVMEFVDNGIIALVPGAMDAHLTDALFWSSLLGGFVVAFVVTTPVNKWLIARGKGHAVVHAYH